MPNNNHRNKETETALATGILPGMKKHFPNGSQLLTFGGGSVTATVDQAVTNLQELIGNRTAVTTAQAAVKVALANENSKMPALIAFLHALEELIRLTFGANATVLADFSLEPPKARVPMTAEAKAIAKAKAQATRAARGPTTAKARKAIKGNVSATLVVTPNAPATATPEPAAPAAPVTTKA